MDNIISNLYMSNGGNSEENDFTWLWISLIVTFAITFLICGCCLWYSIFHNNREETENSVTKPEIYANSSQPLINPRERFRKMFSNLSYTYHLNKWSVSKERHFSSKRDFESTKWWLFICRKRAIFIFCWYFAQSGGDSFVEIFYWQLCWSCC